MHRHLRQTYRFDHFNNGFVELLAAQQTVEEGMDWYQGTADAVRKNIRYIEQRWVDHVLILSGDQLYRMNFEDMMKTHVESGAAVTIAGIPVHRKDAEALGIIKVDDSGRVTGFVEKPKTEDQHAGVRTDPAWIDAHGIPSEGRDLLANMGLYIFNRDVMVDLLTNTDYQDFGKEVFPAALNNYHVQLHLFDGYWEDIGTIRAFYEANLSLTRKSPPFDFSDSRAPVYSRGRFLPPTVVEDAKITSSLIADGCQIGRGTVIEGSVIGLRTVIGDNVTIRNSVIMGADYRESKEDLKEGQIPVGIGDGSVIEGTLLDKNCRIGKNVRITNAGAVENQGEDEPMQVRDGIPVVIKDAEIPDGFQF